MNWVGFAVLLIVVVVGAGMFFTGYTMGMQWVIMRFGVEIPSDESEDKG